MLLPKFEFHEPKTVDEACQMMAEYGASAMVLAGGTDLLVNMKKKLLSPQHLIAISRIEELKKVDSSPFGLKIGACLSVSDTASSDAIGKKWGALSAGAKALGSPQIRNLATIGGNLGTASSAADLPPSLMAYGARVVLKSSARERTLPLEEFFTGSKRTTLADDEMIYEIQIDEPAPYSGAGYESLGVRSCQDIKIVNVASFITLDGPGGIIKSARIVMGCVGPTHLRAHSAEKILVGEKPGEAIFARAGELAMQDATPRGAAFSRASAGYKKDMVGVLTVRTLGTAWKEATGERN